MRITETNVIYGGFFVRTYANQLQRMAWMEGLDCTVEKSGVINQIAKWSVTGEEDQVRDFCGRVSEWIRRAG